MRVIGIDLTGSEKRPSGVACLADLEVMMTARLKSDLDIEDFVLDMAPDLVSIDSPLSLPETPGKIYRDCELELKRRGIGVYWCLLPSMKNLTMRGISLANRLRDRKIPVIESYPGAAQDILGIPRKNKGVDVLAAGLAKYGITGNLKVSHDELDAVTSAIVGILYLKGDYEALGCLILPKKSTVSIDEWREGSRRGELCGIFGCQEKPILQCPQCRNHYCEEHVLVHFHPVKKGVSW